LGLIWALWHIPIYVFLIADPLRIAVQALSLAALRFQMAWLFSNTGKIVFVVIFYHTVYNVIIVMLPSNSIITGLFFLITAIIVTFLWAPETMADFR